MNKLTIFYYANGNNELNPEVYASFLSLCNLPDLPQVQIVVELARCDMELVQLIRSQENLFRPPPKEDAWIGTRRYVIEGGKVSCVGILEGVNMADPKTLYEFLDWGLTYHKAEHYGIFLGGHIYQFVGVSPDFTQDSPYLMGFSQLSWCLYSICLIHKMTFDYLVLDACYSNTYETLFEFARFEQPIFQYLITYREKGPICGFPYALFLDFICRKRTDQTPALTLEDLPNFLAENHFSWPIILLQLDAKILAQCKQLIHYLALHLLSLRKESQQLLPLSSYLENPDTSTETYHLLLGLQTLSKQLIFATSALPENMNRRFPIHLLTTPISDSYRSTLYGKLHFSLDNAWKDLLCNTSPTSSLSFMEDAFAPIPLTLETVQAFVASMNPNLDALSTATLTKKLFIHKNWL